MGVNDLSLTPPLGTVHVLPETTSKYRHNCNDSVESLWRQFSATYTVVTNAISRSTEHEPFGSKVTHVAQLLFNMSTQSNTQRIARRPIASTRRMSFCKAWWIFCNMHRL